jgi:hypothetical protein
MSLPWFLLGTALGAGGMYALQKEGILANPCGCANPAKLISSTETESARRKIASEAAHQFGRGKAELFFEHGAWWAKVGDKVYGVFDKGYGEVGFDRL